MHAISDAAERVPAPDALDDALRDFGHQMRAHRKRLGLRQKDVAEALGVNQSQWSRMESGDFDPSLMTVLRIQAVLEVSSLEDFFGPQPSRRITRSISSATLRQSQ